MNVFSPPQSTHPSGCTDPFTFSQDVSPTTLNSKTVCLVYPNGDVVVSSCDQQDLSQSSVIHLR